MEKDCGSTPTENTMRTEYAAPQVERVMDAEELGREVHYAGSSFPGPIVFPGNPAISDVPGFIHVPFNVPT